MKAGGTSGVQGQLQLPSILEDGMGCVGPKLQTLDNQTPLSELILFLTGVYTAPHINTIHMCIVGCLEPSKRLPDL